MPDETVSHDAPSSSDELPDEAVQALADSTAISVGEQPPVLANLALANQIFNTCLAQQDAIVNQQIANVVKLAALTKCVQVLLAVNVNEPQAVERISRSISEMFDQLPANLEEILASAQQQLNEGIKGLRAPTPSAGSPPQ